ncbi:hypothetical protein J8L73_00915 [Pseudoalteromonas sp. MMG006]|uniref:hypothetical protein n=1 Tax=Pseudoalteromonas sp. MMG006 TaxID=2822683 RepID=UPI001B36E41C|nr:hypothetical protein [Pseudoalteromonas sp. MMG006]MBQ4797712.1 hypothetical protein [Pseudoalteromonas sp. MMG006]
MNTSLLEREEIDFIFDLYRPDKQSESENINPQSTHYKDARKPDIDKNKGVSEYLI